MSTTKANYKIARAAGVVMIAFILSNVMGLVRQILVSRYFGTGQSLDAFYAATTIPDFLFNLLAGGALTSAFIPTFTGLLVKENQDNAWRLASSVMNVSGLVLIVISGVMAVFASQIVEYVLLVFKPELGSTLKELTTNLLRIILIAPAIFGLSGLLMSILNVHDFFLIPALAPVFNWIGWILGIVFLVPRMGIYGLAWGYVLGAFLHLGIQLPVILKLPGWRYLPVLGMNNPSTNDIVRLMLPRMLGVAAVQINFVVNAIIASSLGEGSLSAINIGRMVMTMPLFVVAQAVATAALPIFARQVAQGERSAMRSSLASTLRVVILLSIPSTVGLIFLRQPLIALLFQRGEFDANSTNMVSWALMWYSTGLVGHAIVEILSRAFYALRNTKAPVLAGVIAMGLNIVFSFVFSLLFKQLQWMPHGGLPLANSLATVLEAIILLIIMRRILGGVEDHYLANGVFFSMLAASGMSLGLIIWLSLSRGLANWVVILGGIPIGVIIYGLIAWLLRIEEAHAVTRFILERLKKLYQHAT